MKNIEVEIRATIDMLNAIIEKYKLPKVEVFMIAGNAYSKSMYEQMISLLDDFEENYLRPTKKRNKYTK